MYICFFNAVKVIFLKVQCTLKGQKHYQAVPMVREDKESHLGLGTNTSFAQLKVRFRL